MLNQNFLLKKSEPFKSRHAPKQDKLELDQSSLPSTPNVQGAYVGHGQTVQSQTAESDTQQEGRPGPEVIEVIKNSQKQV